MAKADIGLIGLAVMGENLILNMESKGFTVACYNRTTSKVDDFTNGRAKGKNILGAHSIAELADMLASPRKVMLMVKAGQAVDDFIEQLLPHLSPGDIIIDGGNIYYHLLRRTHVIGKQTELVALVPLGQALNMSESTVRQAIRTLDEKKCVKIEERTKKGHLVRVFLPEEVEGIRTQILESEVTVNIEEIDFYSDRRYLPALLKRENGRCFYTFREVTASSCVLDHVIPLADGGGSNYRNIVVASHEANAMKQGQSAEGFVRQLYRKGVLSTPELEDRLRALEALKAGELKPEI